MDFKNLSRVEIVELKLTESSSSGSELLLIVGAELLELLTANTCRNKSKSMSPVEILGCGSGLSSGLGFGSDFPSYSVISSTESRA